MPRKNRPSNGDQPWSRTRAASTTGQPQTTADHRTDPQRSMALAIAPSTVQTSGLTLAPYPQVEVGRSVATKPPSAELRDTSTLRAYC